MKLYFTLTILAIALTGCTGGFESVDPTGDQTGASTSPNSGNGNSSSGDVGNGSGGKDGSGNNGNNEGGRDGAPGDGAGNNNPPNDPPPAPEVDVAKLSEGYALYNVTCVGCHSPGGSPLPETRSLKDGRSAQQISNAITNQQAMNSFSYLTAEQREAIAYALDPNNQLPVAPGGGEQINVNVNFASPLSIRYLARSIFADIFLEAPFNNEENQINDIINDDVQGQVNGYGGGCSRYDANCGGGLAYTAQRDNAHKARLEAPESPLGHVMRKGYGIQACEKILDKNTAVTNALTKVGLNVGSAASNANIDRVFGLFNPGRAPSSEAITALGNVHADSKNNNLSDTDAWRFVLLPLCKSAELDRL